MRPQELVLSVTALTMPDVVLCATAVVVVYLGCLAFAQFVEAEKTSSSQSISDVNHTFIESPRTAKTRPRTLSEDSVKSDSGNRPSITHPVG